MAYKIIALDFDGVICDSIEECLQVSYMAYLKVKNVSNSDLPAIPDLARTFFFRHRYLVGPPRFYACLWAWLDETESAELTSTDFERSKITLQAEFFDRFETEFFKVRGELKRREFSRWIALNPIYPDVISTWNEISRRPVYIVTTKDEDSVERILLHHQLQVSGIYGHGSFNGKGEAIMEIARKNTVASKDILFIDDHPSHLADVASTGAQVMFAKWGYSSKCENFNVLERLSQLPLT